MDDNAPMRSLARVWAHLGRVWKAGLQILTICGLAIGLMILVLRGIAPETQSDQAGDPTDGLRFQLSEASDDEAPASAEPTPTSRQPSPTPASRAQTDATEGAQVYTWGTGGPRETNWDLLETTASDVSVVKTAATAAGDSWVYNGETITYTIVVRNNALDDITDVHILDVLPPGALDEVSCSEGDCHTKVVTKEVPEPLGGTIVISTIVELNWDIAAIQPDASVTKSFSARVVGQSDGTVIENQAFVRYRSSGVIKTASGNAVKTAARVRVETPGRASVSAAPTWFSEDAGGTLSLDWADFDGDGDLELALGSSLGATVYKNTAGRLVPYWEAPAEEGGHRLAYGVRWADFDNDNQLELVAVGDSFSDTVMLTGTNFIYKWDGGGFREIDRFTTDHQIVRVAPGDYNGDGYVDLVVSTNMINPACPVLLYVNTKDVKDFFTDSGYCINQFATASLSPADFDNDGDLDLALGAFPDTLLLFENVSDGRVLTDTSPFTDSQFLSIDSALSFLPYDFSWGDYNGDGYLDLAAAFPLERKIRIYANKNGAELALATEIRADLFMTPLSISWGDFNGDGALELAIAGSPPKVYRVYESFSDGRLHTRYSQISSLSPEALSGQVWSMPPVDYDNDGDLDLTLSNRDGPSLFFTTFAPFLNTTLDKIGGWKASSVAWGDADGDGYLDLLFGAGEGEVNARLYYNNTKGVFANTDRKDYISSGFGPQSVAFGDLDGDYDLDLAFGTVGTDKVFQAGSTAVFWTSPAAGPSYSVAWGDADDDGDLDVLVGGDGPNLLFANQGGQLTASPVWTSTALWDTRSIAWGDLNGDRYLDIAVGNYDQFNQVLLNNQDNTFTPVFTSNFRSKTRSVAWGDWDGDGDPDLVVGNYGEANVIYENRAGRLITTPVWRSDGFALTEPLTRTTSPNKTTSLAWGDWDNDGDLDLAVGNDGEPDRVFGNLSAPGSPQLEWLWTSSEQYQTAGVAWGDPDRDGDLDLAISQGGTGQNGVYANGYVMPAHLSEKLDKTAPLPNNPSYLSIQRPGETHDAFFFSSAEHVAGPTHYTVEVKFRLYDPDPGGTRDSSRVSPEQVGDKILGLMYEYSTDGGGSWHAATGTPAGAVMTTTRKGYETAFQWNAVTDAAVSDDARFRITVVQQNRNGPFQRARISAISPPFRVRGLTCFWPESPSIIFTPNPPELGSSVTFYGGISAGSGVLTFTWDFGDGSDPENGQVVKHTFTTLGTFDVRLVVTSEPCPMAKTVSTSAEIAVEGYVNFYLPIILASGGGGATVGAPAEADGGHSAKNVPEPVTGFWGRAAPEDGTTYLGWRPNAKEEAITGYRIYRNAATGSGPFQLLVTLPPDGTTFADETAYCGHSYYVTAFNSVGESPPTAGSFFSPPCQGQD